MVIRLWFVTASLRLITWVFSLFSRNFISLKIYQRFCDFCNVPFFLSTEEGDVIFYNKKYSIAFFQGKTPDSKILPEFKNYFENPRIKYKIRLITSSGKPKLIDIEVFNTKAYEISCVGAVVKSTDNFLNPKSITALNSSEMQELLDQDFDYILAVDKDSKHTFCSEELSKVLGYTSEEMLEIKTEQLLDAHNKQAVINAIRKCVKANDPNFNAVISLSNKNKTRTVFLNLKAKIFINNHKFAGLIGVGKDITKEMETQLSERAKINLLDSAIHTVSSMLDNDIDTISAIGELFGKIAAALNVSKICLAQNLEEKGYFKLVQSFESSCRCAAMCECKDKRNYSACMDDHIIRALENDKSVVSNLEESPKMEAFMVENGIQSLAYIPVFIHNKFWGFLTVQDCLHDRIWEASEIATLKLIAICVSSVLSLQDEVQRSEEANMMLGKALELLKVNTARKTEILQQENKRISDSLFREGPNT